MPFSPVSAGLIATAELDEYGRTLILKEVSEMMGLRTKTPLEVTVRVREVMLRVKNVALDEEAKRLTMFLEHESPRTIRERVFDGRLKMGFEGGVLSE